MIIEYKIIIAKVAVAFLTAAQFAIIVGTVGSEMISPFLILALFFIGQLSAFLIFKDDCMTERHREKIKRENSPKVCRRCKMIRLYLRIASIIEAVCGPFLLILWGVIRIKNL